MNAAAIPTRITKIDFPGLATCCGLARQAASRIVAISTLEQAKPGETLFASLAICLSLNAVRTMAHSIQARASASKSFSFQDLQLHFPGARCYRALELGPVNQDQALCNNTVDAIIFAAGHPDGLTQVATTECKARLVPVSGPPIDRLLSAHPYYIASIIPGGMYAGNPKDVPTFGTRVLLVASARQPAELAYAMVKAVFQDFDDFRHLHPVLFVLRPADLVPSEAVMPIHPGAMRYYREAGLIH
jgi:hypothetical protein